MKKFFLELMSIFFDISNDIQNTKNIYNPQDLTNHYRSEIENLSLDGIYIAAHYHDVVASIEAYKYRSDRQYVGQYVDILANVVEKYKLLEGKDVVLVSVPMHWSRYMIRGFNHIDLLVSGLSKKVYVPHLHPIRALFTRRQSKLDKFSRKKNRENAFALNTKKPLPKKVILIDDIISTGSTVQACAKILKDAGVEMVYGVFIASNQ